MVSIWRRAVFDNTVTIEKPSPLGQDTSGGITDGTWVTAFAAVPCHIYRLGPRPLDDFGSAGYVAPYMIATEQDGILAGQRVKFADGSYARVREVKHTQGHQGVPDVWRIMADEVRLA